MGKRSVISIKTLPVILAIGLVFSCSLVSADDGSNYKVREISSSKKTTLIELKGKHRRLKSQAYNGKTRKTTSQFNERKFIGFLSTKYIIERVNPEKITFNLVGDTLTVSSVFPLNVLKRFGMATGADTLYIYVSLDRKAATRATSNPELVTMDLEFHLNKPGDMVVDKIRLYLEGKKFYSE